jgi:centromere-localized protein 2
MLRDVQLFGPSKYGSSGKQHTTDTILKDMSQACADIEAEIAALEAEAADILEDIKKAVDDLSDLRYGRFQRISGVGDDPVTEAIEGLTKLEVLCNAHRKNISPNE